MPAYGPQVLRTHVLAHMAVKHAFSYHNRRFNRCG